MNTFKKQYNSYIELGIFIAVSGIYLTFSKTLIHDIISILILTIGAIFVVRFNLSHPYFWYSIFFSLYAIGYPLLFYLNATPKNYGYSKELLVLHWIALVTFLVVVSPKIVDIKRVAQNVNNYFFVFNKYLFYFLSILVFSFVIYLKIMGFESKNEINSSGSLIIFLGVRLALVYILISAVEIIKSIVQSKKINYWVLLATFILLFLLFFYSAERDFLLRYLVILFFIYYIFIYDKKDRIKIIIISFILFLLIPVSKSIKYLGLRGETVSFNSNLIIEFLTSEFHTQARNVQVLLNHEIYGGYLNGKTFITSLSNVFGITDFSTLKWFHQTFYPESKTGMGFSLVGEGYVNLGYLGVVLMFIIIGLIVKLVYQKSCKNLYNLITYLMLIPISIYTLRADLFNFFSQFLKQVLLIIILFRVTDVIWNKIKKKRKLVAFKGEIH